MTSVHAIFFFFYMMVVIIILCNFGFHSSGSSSSTKNYNQTASSLDVKLKPEEAYKINRKLLFFGSSCTTRDLSISQSRRSSTGIPQYIVQIVNTCVSSGCAPSNIHLHCGWFASARIVNPRFFKRLSYDDCLVNGGRPLKTGQMISFSYSNSFMYPISFKHAKFC